MYTSDLAREINQLHASICGALADPKRILILYLLVEGPLNVNALVEKLQLPQPTVSRHLKVLRVRGLVTAERDRQSVYYELSDRRVIKALDLLRAVLADKLSQQASLATQVSKEFGN